MGQAFIRTTDYQVHFTELRDKDDDQPIEDMVRVYGHSPDRSSIQFRAHTPLEGRYSRTSLKRRNLLATATLSAEQIDEIIQALTAERDRLLKRRAYDAQVAKEMEVLRS